MVHLMPFHPVISASENPEWFIFLVPVYPGCPGKRLLNDCSSTVHGIEVYQPFNRRARMYADHHNPLMLLQTYIHVHQTRIITNNLEHWQFNRRANPMPACPRANSDGEETVWLWSSLTFWSQGQWMSRICHGLWSTKFGVDSSSRFPVRVRTNKQMQLNALSPAGGYTAGVG